MKFITGLTFFVIFTSVIHLNAQTLDEETGFIYVKAEYLFETARYEEAISQYNLVIARDPKYKEALIHRGLSKLALAAYKGSKMDAIQSIELKGISAESAALLGRSFAGMNDINAATSSLTAAIALDAKNSLYYEWRGALYENDDQLIKACQDYEKAMNFGSIAAEMKAKSLCGIMKNKQVVPTQKNKEEDVTSESGNNDASDSNHAPGDIADNEVLSSGNREDQTNEQQNQNPATTTSDSTTIDDSEPIVDDGLPKEDNYVNRLIIDDELTLEISGQELGRREIPKENIPSILILADENGKVTVNICVNKSGIVTKAEFNASKSSIAKKSLVSLALRKAKEFEFSRGEYDLQCGIMVFNIKGS
ncbi:MAG: hypothetical protein H7X99_04980 [Saprospiraceae bacterium]|nr:hypothetical protein [Saprospiraceae bacterium]